MLSVLSKLFVIIYLGHMITLKNPDELWRWFFDAKPKIDTAIAPILESMDPSQHACVDFYQLVCGSFRPKKKIYQATSDMSQFAVTSEEVMHDLKEKFESKTEEGFTYTETKMRSIYRSCMNISALNQMDHVQLRRVVRKFGDWPVLVGDSWEGGGFHWVNTLILFRESGFSPNYFFDVSVVLDPLDTTQYIIEISQPSTTIPLPILQRPLNDSIIHAYYETMIKVALSLGGNEKNVRQDLLRTLIFERKLAEAMLPARDLRDKERQMNRKTLTEINIEYPFIDWVYYIQKIFGKEADIDASRVVIVTAPSFLANLTDILYSNSRTTLANFLMWRLVWDNMIYFDERLLNIKLHMKSLIYGEKKDITRWSFCMDIISSKLRTALGSMYVRKIFRKIDKVEVENIVKDILNEFHKRLSNLEWMDPSTLEAAQNKLSSMQYVIGNPDELEEVELIDSYYKPWVVSQKNLFINILRIRLLNMQKQFSLLNETTDKSRWVRFSSATNVNAYFYQLENRIFIPAALLRGPFYDTRRPSYINFGSLGSIIGHEIIHAFDDKGRHFDEHGNLRNWWGPDSEKEFLKRAQCFIDQYNSYIIPEVSRKVDGEFCLGENIADNGGIKLAYQAYWTHPNRTPELDDKSSSKYNYTDTQLFWISAANIWCGRESKEMILLKSLSDEHSPRRFRVNGVVANFVEFGEAFNCNWTESRNTSKICEIW